MTPPPDRPAATPSRERVKLLADRLQCAAMDYGSRRTPGDLIMCNARDALDAALASLADDAALVRDYQARMIAAGSLLCEPVSSRNLREAKAFLNPAYHDAADAYRAARAVSRSPIGETPEDPT